MYSTQNFSPDSFGMTAVFLSKKNSDSPCALFEAGKTAILQKLGKTGIVIEGTSIALTSMVSRSLL